MFGNGARGLAQEASPPRPSHIHAGDCDELKEVVQPLTALTVPSENVRGNADAVVAEAAFTNIPQTLDELLASDHSVKVHLSKDEITVYLVCGDIGGAVDANGALIVGLKELDGSGYTGIAYLAPGPNGGTDVSVMIAKVLPGGGAGDDTAGATTGNAGGAATELSVSLTEFAIATETTAPAGAIVFNISNDGAAPHSFVIEGEGIKKQLGRNLQPGESTTLEVTLSPGVYTIYCPVGEGKHRANGMEVELTVE
jgi:uncharacterized cupredoxin-like copper-binding protein